MTCNGCKIYGADCHCLCHKGIDCPGYHEIIYSNGEIKRSNIIKRIYNYFMGNNEI